MLACTHLLSHLHTPSLTHTYTHPPTHTPTRYHGRSQLFFIAYLTGADADAAQRALGNHAVLGGPLVGRLVDELSQVSNPGNFLAVFLLQALFF